MVPNVLALAADQLNSFIVFFTCWPSERRLLGVYMAHGVYMAPTGAYEGISQGGGGGGGVCVCLKCYFLKRSFLH